MVDSPVLVLNQNYEPLNVCNARRAVVLIDRGKAEVLEHGPGFHPPFAEQEVLRLRSATERGIDRWLR